MRVLPVEGVVDSGVYMVFPNARPVRGIIGGVVTSDG